jgi:hypothetical protein
VFDNDVCQQSAHTLQFENAELVAISSAQMALARNTDLPQTVRHYA